MLNLSSVPPLSLTEQLVSEVSRSLSVLSMTLFFPDPFYQALYRRYVCLRYRLHSPFREYGAYLGYYKLVIRPTSHYFLISEQHTTFLAIQRARS